MYKADQSPGAGVAGVLHVTVIRRRGMHNEGTNEPPFPCNHNAFPQVRDEWAGKYMLNSEQVSSEL